MDESKLQVFNAIAAFVQDLNTCFGKKYKPVALYNRLVEKTTLQDVNAIDRHINAFRTFFNRNSRYILKQELDSFSKVEYSDRVYLDISKLISSSSSPEDKDVIHKHLVKIFSLMNSGTKEAREALETIAVVQSAAVDNKDFDIDLPNTTEGNFIKDTLDEMTGHFEGMDQNANPMQMMAGMMQSGFFQKFMGDMQSKMSSGEMTIQSLMGTVTNVISDVVPKEGKDAAKLQQVMSQSMGQISELTGGQNLPPEIQGQMSQLMAAMTGGQPDDPTNQPTTDQE